MHQKSLVELAADLKSGVYTSEELTRDSLQRIRQFDERLNSFVTVTETQALAAAQAADAVIKAGPVCPQGHFLYQRGQDQLWFENAG
jgi:aspartyl-tRNA(Asn)/glutamyl-tRNA(Gln) amidotransferase subunit A